MLITLPQFEYLSSRSLEEACSLLSTHRGEARVLAGGTDLLIKMKHKKLKPRYLINIKGIADMSTIHHNGEGGLRMGALSTIQAIANSPVVRKKYSVLAQAASVMGTRQVRNLATLGGNLCNASPAAESAPALLTLEARAHITGPDATRTVPLEGFFLGPERTVLQEGEILSEIVIPNPPFQGCGVYLKHSTRRVDVAIVGLAMLVHLDGQVCREARIGLGAVGPTPFRARKAEEILRGQKLSDGLLEKAAEVASEQAIPIDDLRGYADYRRKMIEVLVKEAMERIVSGMRL